MLRHRGGLGIGIAILRVGDDAARILARMPVPQVLVGECVEAGRAALEGAIGGAKLAGLAPDPDPGEARLALTSEPPVVADLADIELVVVDVWPGIEAGLDTARVVAVEDAVGDVKLLGRSDGHLGSVCSVGK